MARLQLSAQLAAPGWPVLTADAALGEGRLDYQGQTQAGQPVSTSSRHTERELSLRWRPLAAGWGEVWLGVSWLHARRAIGSSPAAGGLIETSSLLLPGIQWRSPSFSLPSLGQGASLRVETEWRASARHRLAVDYLGVFDSSSLRAGQRQEAVLRLAGSTRPEWRWAVEWSHAHQSASAASALFRAGVPVGTVVQPKIRIDDISVSLMRAF